MSEREEQALHSYSNYKSNCVYSRNDFQRFCKPQACEYSSNLICNWNYFGLAGTELGLTESLQSSRERPDEAADGKDCRIAQSSPPTGKGRLIRLDETRRK